MLLEGHTEGSLGAVSLLVQALAFQQKGEGGKSLAKLQQARHLLEANAPLPGRPKSSEYTGYSNSVRWCEACALLIKVKKELGDRSDFSQELLNLRGAGQESQPETYEQ